MTTIRFVPNSTKYWEFIRELRNDPEIREGFVEQIAITKVDQCRYMEKHNDDYYICLHEGVPVGYIGAVDNDIRIAVHKDYQRQGIGEAMVREFMLLKPDSRAKILIYNTVSQKLFEKCGFTRVRQNASFYYYEI